MTVPFMVKVPDFLDVEVDAAGEIEVGTQGGYYGEMEWRTFDVADLRKIADFAERHHAAYEAYTESGYEDEDAYYAAMPEVTRE